MSDATANPEKLERSKLPPGYETHHEPAGVFYSCPPAAGAAAAYFLTIPEAWAHFEREHNPPGCTVGAAGVYTPDVDTRRLCYFMADGAAFTALDWSNESIHLAHVAAWAHYWHTLT